MKRGTPMHPKTLALAAELGLERWGAVGILESLWHFTANYAKRGDIGKHTDAVIAAGIGWTGDPQRLASALLASGWVDACSCHRLRIHDWPEHADQTVQRSEEWKKLGPLPCYNDASSVLAASSSNASQPTPSLRLALPEPDLASTSQASPAPEPDAPPGRSRSRPKIEPPEGLEGEDWRRLVARLWNSKPHLVAKDERPPAPHCSLAWVRAQSHAALDHFRGKGEKRPDWPATCSTWVHRSDDAEWSRLRRSPPLRAEYHADPETFMPDVLREKPDGSESPVA